jgi:hypothetical protein
LWRIEQFDVVPAAEHIRQTSRGLGPVREQVT